jgi:hypothetical protein
MLCFLNLCHVEKVSVVPQMDVYYMLRIRFLLRLGAPEAARGMVADSV